MRKTFSSSGMMFFKRAVYVTGIYRSNRRMVMRSSCSHIKPYSAVLKLILQRLAAVTMTTDYVAKVLRIAPSTWQPDSYRNKNYLTVDLENASTEYEDIVSVLRDTHDSLAERICSIQRVQHPFAYGRFVLRKEQLEKRENKKYIPMRYFLQVKESQIKDALGYNMDKRRTPFDCNNRRSDPDKCVVVVQSLRHPQDWKVHSESYPEYVVFYNGIAP